MIEIQALARRWGNSIAVIIPADIVENQKIVENESLVVRVEKRRPKAGVLWGYLKNWRTPTQQLKNGVRTDWMSATDIKEEEAWRARQAKK